MPLFTKYFIDSILPAGDLNKLNILGLLLLGILIFGQIVDFIRAIFSSLLSQKISWKLGLNAFKKLLNCDYQKIQRNQSGYWFSRILNDAFDLGDAFENIVQILTNLLLFIVGIGFTFYFSIELGIAITFLIPIYIIVIKKLNPKIRERNKEAREANAKLSGLLDETVSRIIEVKTLFIEALKVNQINTTWSNAINVVMKNIKLVSLSNVIGNTIASLGTISILWYGGHLVINGKLSIGELIALNSFLGYVISPLEGLMNINQQIQSIFVAFGRIKEIEKMDLSIENNLPKIIHNKVSNKLIIHDLNFNYTENDKIFKDYNLEFELKNFTCISSPSGRGKSTLLKILSGLLTPSSGNIEFQTTSNTHKNSEIILIPQNALIFSDTFWNNIKLNRNINDEDIISVVNNMQLDDVVNRMPHGYDTNLGAFNGSISGGEKQRIAIARAIVTDPEILLIDEMTSEIDEETENKIFSELRKLRKDKITIFVTHRKSSFSNADKIITL